MKVDKVNNKKMLITGVSGLLGNNLAYYFRDKYELLGIYLSNPVTIEGIRTQKADLLSTVSFENTIQGFNPDVIIHCAAITDIDLCEKNKELTDNINILGTRALVEVIKNNNTKLIFISSDSVYEGSKGNYIESDQVNPQNYYGISKSKGELEILRKDSSLIFRTNIFGWNVQNKKSLGEWIIQELQTKRKIYGFKDAYFSSIYTFELAKILDMAIDHDLMGIYNCGSSTSLSKYEFAINIAKCFGLDSELIQPISIDDFNFTAKRGKNLTLNVDKLERSLNCTLPTIYNSIKAFQQDFRTKLPAKIRSRLLFDQS